MPVAHCKCGRRYKYTTKMGLRCPACRKQHQLTLLRKFNTHRTQSLDSRLWHKWRLTEEKFVEILEEQGGGCAICGAPEMAKPGERRTLNIDHCHTTDRIRGIL